MKLTLGATIASHKVLATATVARPAAVTGLALVKTTFINQY